MIRLTKATLNGLQGTITVPGDKSISHRAIMFGAVAKGVTHIKNPLLSDDVLRTIAAFQAMGVTIKQTATDIYVTGNGFSGLTAPKQPLNMGNSGTTTRLLMGLLSRQNFNMTLFGDESLSCRPMNRVAIPLSQMGAKIKLADKGTLPMRVGQNNELHGIVYDMPVASAQVKSAILLAGIQAKEQTTVVENLASRDHTERMIKQFGGNVHVENGMITVTNNGDLKGQIVSVPADISSAAFFLVAGLIVPNSKITLKNVGINPTRDGVIKLLSRMGAKFKMTQCQMDLEEPVADIEVQTQALHGIEIVAEDIPSAVDEIPIIALAATQATGDTRITGAKELRIKETDRISAIITVLTKLGANIDEYDDGMIIHGRTALHANSNMTVINSYGDHRIAMMVAIAALITDGNVELSEEDVVNVSYPNFFTDLLHLLT